MSFLKALAAVLGLSLMVLAVWLRFQPQLMPPRTDPITSEPNAVESPDSSAGEPVKMRPLERKSGRLP